MSTISDIISILTNPLILWIIIISLVYWLWKSISRYGQLNSKYKSVSVIHGQNIEEFIPFMKNYPYNPQNAKFIGMPIDLIQFEDDKIVFVEVKTGKSKLSEKQERIKSLIQDKKIIWDVIKI